MTRELSLNRWNWDDKTEKWIYVKLNKEGKKEFFYRIEPPQEFIELSMKLKNLNEKLLITKDPEENERLFNEMMKITKRLQSMRNKDP